jgi:hypothetical protein
VGIVRREFPSILRFTEDLKDTTEAARGIKNETTELPSLATQIRVFFSYSK